MTAHVKTITNGVNLFGGKLSTKWGDSAFDTFTWGTSTWGQGTSLLTEFTKIYANDIAVSNVVYKGPQKIASNTIVASNIIFKDITKLASNTIIASNVVSKEPTKVTTDSVTTSFLVVNKFIDKVIENSLIPTSEIAKGLELHIYNTMIMSGDLSSEEKLIGDWNYVFTNNKNAEYRDASQWASQSTDASTYITIAHNSTNWTPIT